MVEHKSAQKDSDKDFKKAYEQAMDYVKGLSVIDRPKFIVICNFQKFQLFNIHEKKVDVFLLRDLRQNIRKFEFVLDFHRQLEIEEEKATLEAGLRTGDLHERIEATGYKGHDLELLLVRLLFCLFADLSILFSWTVCAMSSKQ